MKKIWEACSLGDHFEEVAKRYRDKIAITDGIRMFSYEQLLNLAIADRKSWNPQAFFHMRWSFFKCRTA